MPVEFIWIDEPNIAQIRVQGKVNHDDVERWLDLGEEALERSNYYCCLLDMRGMDIFAYNPLKHGRLTMQLRHPHLGWTAVVGTTPLIAFWLEMLAKVGRLRFRVFNQSEDAIEFLRDLVAIEAGQRAASANQASDSAA
jgi:hypothetical protein